jgi:hypothetical protein
MDEYIETARELPDAEKYGCDGLLDAPMTAREIVDALGSHEHDELSLRNGCLAIRAPWPDTGVERSAVLLTDGRRVPRLLARIWEDTAEVFQGALPVA